MTILKPIKNLECCCCGQETKGRQWWNRDTGYGLCNKCIPYHEKDYNPEEMRLCFGEKGVHYNV